MLFNLNLSGIGNIRCESFDVKRTYSCETWNANFIFRLFPNLNVVKAQSFHTSAKLWTLYSPSKIPLFVLRVIRIWSGQWKRYLRRQKLTVSAKLSLNCTSAYRFVYLLTILNITRCSGGRNELMCFSTSDISRCNISFRSLIWDILNQVDNFFHVAYVFPALSNTIIFFHQKNIQWMTRPFLLTHSAGHLDESMQSTHWRKLRWSFTTSLFRTRRTNNCQPFYPIRLYTAYTGMAQQSSLISGGLWEIIAFDIPFQHPPCEFDLLCFLSTRMLDQQRKIFSQRFGDMLFYLIPNNL